VHKPQQNNDLPPNHPAITNSPQFKPARAHVNPFQLKAHHSNQNPPPPKNAPQPATD